MTRWKGVAYYQSEDPKAKNIGIIAWTLLILSTLVTIWLAVVWTQDFIQSTQNSLNSDLNLSGY